MEKVDDISIIKNAFWDRFTGKIPDFKTEPERCPGWYTYRMNLCKDCPSCSLNMKYDEIVRALTDNDGFFDDEVKKPTLLKQRLSIAKYGICTQCGCNIQEKCWSMDEACGLETTGHTPKWNRLVLATKKGTSDFDFINESKDVININLTDDGEAFVIDFGNIPDNFNPRAFVLLNSKVGEIRLLTNDIGCGCTGVVGHLSIDANSDASYRLDVSILVKEKNMSNKTVFKKMRMPYTLKGSKDSKFLDIIVQAYVKETKNEKGDS